MRVGVGYDVHAFDEGRTLVLGGVTIPDAPGLAGWSDADVVCHALTDALLGAAGLGDLGDHYPAEAVPEGVSSLELMRNTAHLVGAAGFKIENVDVVVVAQEVRVGPHRQQMRERVAAVLEIGPQLVSIKATTTDRLGFTGRGEGIAAVAVALLAPQ